MKKKCVLSFFVSMFFIVMVSNPALTQDDGLKGVIVGGGTWFALFNPSVEGNYSMSIRVNFRGNASGGHMHMTVNNGDYLLIEVDPEFSSILYGEWDVLPAGNFVTGYAFWGIGQIVDTNKEGYLNYWCLLGAYDGGKSDYGVAFHGLEAPLERYIAEILYAQSLSGSGYQPLPLWVVMDKGNVKINVMEK